MHQDNLRAALALASAGIKIFPAGPDKRPLLKGWPGRLQHAMPISVEYWCDHAAGGAGDPLSGRTTTSVVIDCDGASQRRRQTVSLRSSPSSPHMAGCRRKCRK